MLVFDDMTELYQFISTYEHKGKVDELIEVNETGATFYARASKLDLGYTPVAAVPLSSPLDPMATLFVNFEPNKADYAMAEAFLANPDADYKTFFFEPRYVPHTGVESSIKCHLHKDGSIVEETAGTWFNAIEPMLQGYLNGAL